MAGMRRRPASPGLVLLIAAVLLLAIPGAARTEAATAPSGVTAADVGTTALAAASASLARGDGPAAGSALSCSSSGPDAARCAVSSTSNASGPVWGSLDPGPDSRIPFQRAYAPLVWDASDGYVLLFGGGLTTYTYYLTNDTWIFSDGAWTQLHPAQAPSPRDAETLVYDPTLGGGEVVLFGGYGQESLGAPYVDNDTWTYHAGVWTNVTVAGAPAPPASWGQGSAYDAQDGYLLVFGGVNGDYVSLGSTWSYAASGWVNRTPSGGPAPRNVPGLAYDAADHEVVMFGGLNTTDYDSFNDTWTYAGGLWTELSPSPAPPGRDDEAMAYSTDLSKVVMYGGYNESTDVAYNDTWTFAGGSWTNVTPPGPTPGPLDDAGLAEEGSGPMILFGGYNAELYNDSQATWTFSGSAWQLVPLPGASGPRVYSPAMVYDARDGYVLLFGGGNDYAETTNATWTWSQGNWTQLHPALSPPPLLEAGIAFDSALNEVVLFSGEGFDAHGNPTFTNQTWTFAGGAWTNRTATAGAAPTARYGAAMAYDAGDATVVLFGGYGYNATASAYQYFSDTWAYDGTWRQLSEPAPPPGREGASLVFDPAENASILFGGYDDGELLGDTWELVDLAWTEPLETVAPQAREFAQAAWDPETASLVLYGGLIAGPYSYLDAWDTWSFADHAWTELTANTDANMLASPSNPGGRNGGGLAYDPADGLLLLYGGSPAQSPGPDNDLWAFDVVGATASAPVVTGTAPLTVSFTGAPVGGVAPYAYRWTFGDGTSSSAADPTHGFAMGGNYTVTFTVTDALGAQASTTLVVSARSPLFADASASVGGGPAPLTVQFRDSATGGAPPYTYAWRFGDGATSAVADPAHTYATAGTYEAFVWTNDSASDSVVRSVNVTVNTTSSPGGSSGSGSSSGTGFSGTWLAIGLVVGLALGAAVGLLLARRGRTRGGTTPPPIAVFSPPPPPPPPPGTG